MLIEFIGSPGAGKSTFLPVVTDFLRQNGASVYGRRDAARLFGARSKVGRLVRFVPRPLQDKIVYRLYQQPHSLQQHAFQQSHPDLITYVTNSQMDRPPEACIQLRRVLPSFYNLIGQYGLLTALKQPGDVFVFDEGFAHRVIPMNVSNAETPVLKRLIDYLDLIPKADILIYVHVPPDACMCRIKKRGLSEYLSTMDETQLVRFFENSQTVVKMTVDYLSQMGWDIIEVDNSQDDPAIAAEQMRADLSRRILSLVE